MNSVVFDTPRAASSDPKFHLGMALVCAFLVVTGFGSSFFLKDVSAFPVLVHMHGAIFVAWIGLYVTQTALVRADRRDLHRRLGVLGAVLAVAVVWVGMKVSLARVASGVMLAGLPPAVLFGPQLTMLLLFSAFVTLAIYCRRDRDTHKRLMLLANISIMAPAIARYHLEIFGYKGPVLAQTLTLLLIVPGIVHDLRARGSVHSAYVWGGLAIVVTTPLRFIVARTDAWQAFAKWLAS